MIWRALVEMIPCSCSRAFVEGQDDRARIRGEGREMIWRAQVGDER